MPPLCLPTNSRPGLLQITVLCAPATTAPHGCIKVAFQYCGCPVTAACLYQHLRLPVACIHKCKESAKGHDIADCLCIHLAYAVKHSSCYYYFDCYGGCSHSWCLGRSQAVFQKWSSNVNHKALCEMDRQWHMYELPQDTATHIHVCFTHS